MKAKHPTARRVGASLIATASLAALCNSAVAEVNEEKKSLAEDRKSVAVTIYNDALALIREERSVKLDRGSNRIAMRDVSAKIKPETASLKSLSGGGLTLLEQNYDFDLLTPTKLLEKYVGQNVTIIRTHPTTSKETRETATVLSAQNGIVLRYPDRIETGLPEHARIAYNNVPSTLRDRPTLIINLESDTAGAQQLELAYLTSGFSWRADYVATLDKNETHVNLAGWVTLTNSSGSTFENAKLQLVAGEVNRVQQPVPAPYDNAVNERRVLKSVQDMTQQKLFEYHMYTLERPTTLRDNQTKQVALLSVDKVPVQKEYRLQGQEYWYRFEQQDMPELGDKRNVEVFVEFSNRKPLGLPLPKGIVRVYKNDNENHPIFVGEDSITHTPKNETVRLKLGEAFDLTGNWKRTDYQLVSKRVFEQAITIELKNAKDVPATIKVVEPIPGDWNILSESHPHEKADAHNAMWNIKVPADGKAVLQFRVRSKY